MAALKTLIDYGAPFQVKTIGALLTRKEFVQNIHDILSDEHFPNPAHKWIINEILQYWSKYHTVISMDTLKIEVKKIDNDVLKTSIVEQLKEAANDLTMRMIMSHQTTRLFARKSISAPIIIFVGDDLHK
jgi:replicative DNA helicase